MDLDFDQIQFAESPVDDGAQAVGHDPFACKSVGEPVTDQRRTVGRLDVVEGDCSGEFVVCLDKPPVALAVFVVLRRWLAAWEHLTIPTTYRGFQLPSVDKFRRRLARLDEALLNLRHSKSGFRGRLFRFPTFVLFVLIKDNPGCFASAEDCG